VSENSKISWTDHTFNPWWGCTEVSPGCDHCYARDLAKRYGHAVWGKGVERRVFGEKHWREPLTWNRKAAQSGVRARVFCASMADIFDVDAPPGELDKLWQVVRDTPWLDWLLLTKRPNQAKLPNDWGDGYPNVWLGTSVESDAYLWRARELLRVPAAVHFVSYEPALERVAFGPYLRRHGPDCACLGCFNISNGTVPPVASLDWIIVGGESGPNHRPFDEGWALDVAQEAQKAGVAVWMKQAGGRHSETPFTQFPELNDLRQLPVVVPR
jgi:protein gp37